MKKNIRLLILFHSCYIFLDFYSVKMGKEQNAKLTQTNRNKWMKRKKTEWKAHWKMRKRKITTETLTFKGERKKSKVNRSISLFHPLTDCKCFSFVRFIFRLFFSFLSCSSFFSVCISYGLSTFQSFHVSITYSFRAF